MYLFIYGGFNDFCCLHIFQTSNKLVPPVTWSLGLRAQHLMRQGKNSLGQLSLIISIVSDLSTESRLVGGARGMREIRQNSIKWQGRWLVPLWNSLITHCSFTTVQRGLWWSEYCEIFSPTHPLQTIIYLPSWNRVQNHPHYSPNSGAVKCSDYTRTVDSWVNTTGAYARARMCLCVQELFPKPNESK